MTVANIARKSGPFTSDGLQTTYSFAFRILSAEELDVYTDELLVDPSQYTVAGVGDDTGGSVTFTTAPAVGVIVWLFGDTIKQQPTSYPQNGPFPSISHENGLDRSMMVLWEQEEAQERVPRFAPETLPDLRNMLLPQPVPLKLWSWDSLGTGITYVDSAILTVEPLAGGGSRVEAQATAAVTSVAGENELRALSIVPAGSVLKSAVAFNQIAFSSENGLTSYRMGTALAPERFGQAISIALSAQSNPGMWVAYAEEPAPTALDIVLQGNGGAFGTTGVAIVTVVYDIYTVPQAVP